MRHRKMKQCIAAFAAVHKRGDLGPEQEQAVESVILRLKQFGRLKNASDRDAYDCIAEISQKLVNAFCKSKVKL